MNDDQASYLKILPARPAAPIELDVQSFLLDCPARNLSANTLHNYTPPLATFVRFMSEQGITTATNQPISEQSRADFCLTNTPSYDI